MNDVRRERGQHHLRPAVRPGPRRPRRRRFGLSPYLDAPLCTERGGGLYLYGIDGRRHIDFNLSNGATLLRHDHPAARAALLESVNADISEPVTTWSDALPDDHAMDRAFVQGCVERGVYFHDFTRAGAPGHAGFSTAHGRAVFDEALNIAEAVAAGIAAGR